MGLRLGVRFSHSGSQVLHTTGEQTGAFIPFRMCDQNTTVPRRAAHSHFYWTSDGTCHSPGISQLSTKLAELLAATTYSLQFTAYIAHCAVYSVQFTVYSARFLSLFCLYQLVPPLHVGLSSPGSLPVVSSCWGRTHYTLRGGGIALQDRKKKMYLTNSAPFQQSHWGRK